MHGGCFPGWYAAGTVVDSSHDAPPASPGDTTAELETPVMLLAMPQVLDPFFHKSVVLLIHHEEEGSVGFIVNRPTKIKITEVFEGLDLTWSGSASSLASFGGPVQPQQGTVLFKDDEVTVPAEDESSEDELSGGISQVCPGVAMIQQLSTLRSLAVAPPPSLRLFLGYAGWDGGQLEQEIRRNDWLIAPADDALVFAEDPEQVWIDAMSSIGIDPANLPQWTGGGGQAVH